MKKILRKIRAKFVRIGLKNTDFSIISNNCWGGVLYDYYNMQYLSPTIGIIITPKDYIKFIKNLKYYFNQELTKVDYIESHNYLFLEKEYEKHMAAQDNNDYLELANPSILNIGRLDDIEIIFLHYKTFDDAKNKWNRRVKRINFDNLIIKFNDQNDCEVIDYIEFNKLDYKNKIFFTSNDNMMLNENSYFIKKYNHFGYAVDDIFTAKKVFWKKYLNKIKSS